MVEFRKGTLNAAVACLGLFCCAQLLTGCGANEDAAQASGLTKVRFMADWLAVPEQGGFFQALAMGYYEDAGLDVEIIHRTGNTLQALAVAHGDVDISIGGSDEVLLGIGKGLPLQMLSAFFQNHPYCLMFHAGHKVSSFEELDGVSVMAFLGSTWIPYVEQKYGIKLRLIPLEQTIQRFMADSSREFVQAVFITNEPFVALKEGVATETLLISESGWNPYKVIFSSRKFIEANPEAIEAFVAASLRGWEYYLSEDPTLAHVMIADRNPAMDPEYMEYIRQSLIDEKMIVGDPELGQGLGHLSAERLIREMNILKDLGMVDATYGISRLVAAQFLPANQDAEEE